MPKKNLNETLNAEVSLFLTDAGKYQKVIVDILKNVVTSKKLSGIYVALNKPSKTLTAFFKKKNRRQM
jgi:16S rRNA U516 pseudouridylate synthase RsuA-like enzyme